MGWQNEPDGGNYYQGTGLFDPPPQSPSGINLQVNKDNVLQVRATILHAVDDADAKLKDTIDGMRMEPCGQDPVSIEAAAAWNARLVDAPDSYAKRLTAYIDSLHNLCDQLKDTAKQYGYTEDDITNAFNAIEDKRV